MAQIRVGGETPNKPNDDLFSKRRRRLYKNVFEQCAKQYINYQKFYLASMVVGKWSSFLNYVTTIIGAVLLIILGQAWAKTPYGWAQPATIVLSAVITALSLVDAVEDWENTSHIYHNSGRKHQHLYEKYRNFIQMDVADVKKEYEPLEREAEELLEEKQRLNQVTPQLDSFWYRLLKTRKVIRREPLPLEDIRDGKWNIVTSQKMSKGIKDWIFT